MQDSHCDSHCNRLYDYSTWGRRGRSRGPRGNGDSHSDSVSAKRHTARAGNQCDSHILSCMVTSGGRAAGCAFLAWAESTLVDPIPGAPGMFRTVIASNLGFVVRVKPEQLTHYIWLPTAETAWLASFAELKTVAMVEFRTD